MKPPRPPLVGCAAALLSLCACGTLEYGATAERNPDYAGHLDRLLVVYHRGNQEDVILGRRFSERFLEQLTARLEAGGIQVESVTPDPASWDPTATVRSGADQYLPRQVLHAALTKVFFRDQAEMTDPGGFLGRSQGTELRFSFEVFDLETNTGAWRSSLSFRVVPNPVKLADQLTDQLERDRLFPPPG